MPNRMETTFKYIVFAAIATAINIASQELSLHVYAEVYSIAISVLFGTMTGLVAKYYLDKKFIFNFYTRDALHDGKTFVLYTLMGVATTAIFWGFEFSFDALFDTKEMRYLGGVIGLAIGYYVKYQLDKHFVFIH